MDSVKRWPSSVWRHWNAVASLHCLSKLGWSAATQWIYWKQLLLSATKKNTMCRQKLVKIKTKNKKHVVVLTPWHFYLTLTCLFHMWLKRLKSNIIYAPAMFNFSLKSNELQYGMQLISTTALMKEITRTCKCILCNMWMKACWVCIGCCTETPSLCVHVKCVKVDTLVFLPPVCMCKNYLVKLRF